MNRACHALLVCSMIVVLAGCSEGFRLDQAYRSIYLSKYAIDFPDSATKLDNCRTRNVESCIQLYEDARNGKQKLLSINADKALSHTLETIQQHCLLQSDPDRELCHGAIMALYYFRTEQQDQRILESFRQFSPELRRLIFGNSQFAWFSNRTNREAWIKYVGSIPEELFVKVAKQAVVNYFRTPVQQYTYLGITLL